MAFAINDQTGEVLMSGVDGQWSPAPKAQNDKGETLVFDGSGWTPLPNTQQAQSTPSRAETAGRAVGDFANQHPILSDVVQSLLAAPPKAIAAIPGMAADIPNLYGRGVDYLGRKIGGAITGKEIPAGTIYGPSDEKTGLFQAGGADFKEALNRGIEATGLPRLHEPTTLPGKVADTATQFATAGGALGGARAAITGAGSGALSEGAGNVPGIKGSDAEPLARVLTAILASSGLNAVMPTRNADTMLQRRLEDTPPQDFAAARQRAQTAQNSGAPLLPGESLDNPQIANLTADVAVSPQGGAVGAFMRDRATNLPGVIRDQMAPDIASAPPYMRAAGTRDAGRALTQESQAAGYTASNAQTIDPNVIRPVINQVQAALLSGPRETEGALGRLYENLVNSGGNISRIDEARKIARDLIDTKIVATSAEELAKHHALVRRLAPIVEDLTTALRTNQDFRGGFDTYKAGAPAVGVMRQIDEALEGVRATQGGPNRMVGVNVRNQMLGNDPGTVLAQQTEESIRRAAANSGANPDAAWQGAQRVFDTLERTGRIPGPGSPTAGRAQIGQEAAAPGVLGKAAEAANVTRGSFLQTVTRGLSDRYSSSAYRQLADVLSNPSPQTIDTLERIARTPQGTNVARYLVPLAAEQNDTPSREELARLLTQQMMTGVR